MNTIHVIQAPSGRFVYAGTVPAAIGWVDKKTGRPPTPKQIDAAKHCGPGIAGLTARAFDSYEEALQTARDFGVILPR